LGEIIFPARLLLHYFKELISSEALSLTLHNFNDHEVPEDLIFPGLRPGGSLYLQSLNELI
jgi:hypothetical protein